MIRLATEQDSLQIALIYNYYIENTIITFEEIKLSEKEIKKRIKEIIKFQYPYLVFEENNQILGYAYACQIHDRSGFRFSAESSVYLKPENVNKGIGTQLYQALLNVLKEKGIKTIIAGIALPNDESRALHQKFNFEKVAHFKNIGFKHNKWIDLENWQVML